MIRRLCVLDSVVGCDRCPPLKSVSVTDQVNILVNPVNGISCNSCGLTPGCKMKSRSSKRRTQSRIQRLYNDEDIKSEIEKCESRPSRTHKHNRSSKCPITDGFLNNFQREKPRHGIDS